ncbi:9,11-endoperoxide prostaglandin H2 reductase-like isoform X2 [Branchiostoma lanceolatum]|uniref:9,11-endoperoxide prostaglandin H2 reductase-like isoform X2 n=1 Tax=Branchiostoma lanceolatum TaxID=7740 RepID=UPI003454BB2D
MSTIASLLLSREKMATKVSTECVVLSNGVKMPILGLGTSHHGGFSQSAVVYALRDCGIRLIDTAKRYGCEEKLGAAIKQSGVPREQIFVTTKLWPLDYGYESTKTAFKESCKRLGVDYLDLYLIHWPDCPRGKGQDNRTIRADTWRALEDLYSKGLCKAIGVSNFLIPHLEQLIQDCTVVPHVNQVEYHPYQNPRDLIKFCQAHHIAVEGYCPLAKGCALNEPAITAIAAKYHKMPAQILIRWSIQSGVITIPKSTKEERIRENCQVFDLQLSKSDMECLNSLHADIHMTWDPAGIP